MKLIQQSAEIIKQTPGIIGVYKQVEWAARLCYKSTDKITEDSYKRFIDMLSSKGHNSPLEHGTIYLSYNMKEDDAINAFDRYIHNPYSRVVCATVEGSNTICITTNYRVLIENEWLEDLNHFCEPTIYHIKRISVHIITSIGISRELNRHRCHSICEESTRYCNYSKDKFGNELTFIKPCWFNSSLIDDTGHWDANSFYRMSNQSVEEDAFLGTLLSVEKSYFNLLECGWKPQQARDVLPLCTKTELIHTAFADNWEEFFKLRCSSAAHPMMQELANKIKESIYEI